MPNNQRGTIEGSVENWENGTLGKSLENAEISTHTPDDLLDTSVGLKAISIRLDEEMLKDLRFFAGMEGLGYQPLIRQILSRWIKGETEAYNKYRPEDIQATDKAERRTA